MTKDTLNKQIFFAFVGLFFALPSKGEIFLQYLAPIILKDSNPAIHLGIAIIMILVLIGSITWLITIPLQIHKMRGILTYNHLRNMIFYVLFGSITGMFLKAIVF